MHKKTNLRRALNDSEGIGRRFVPSDLSVFESSPRTLALCNAYTAAGRKREQNFGSNP